MVAALLVTVARALAADAAPGFEVIRTVAGGGSPPDGLGDGGPATQAALTFPQKVAVDSTGNFYIADGGRVRKVDTSGIITTVAGGGESGFSGDGGPATEAQILANGVAIGSLGNLYISGGERVRRVDTSGIITTVAGTGEFGFGGDGGPATQALLANPQGIDVDGLGNLYIAEDQNKRIRKVDTFGIITTVAGGGASGVLGDGGPAIEAYIDFPQDVEVDSAGNLYIADGGGNTMPRIRRVDTSGIITTVAGGGVPADGLGDGGPATSAALSSPGSVAVDAAGNLYIADSGNNRIRKVDSSGIITTVAGEGMPADGLGDGGPPRQGQLGGPRGVEVDERRGLLIADSFSSRVRQVITVPDLLAVIKGDTPDPVNIHEQLTYTIEVTNNGTAAATGIELADTLPGEVRFDSATASQGTCTHAGRMVTCSLGELGPGAKATATVVGVPTTPGFITNTATVRAAGSDPFPGNNTATTETAVGDRGCGQVITRSTRLSEDIGPCPANGIVVGADDVTLDLAGHHLFGSPGPSDGNSAGIRLPGRSGVRVVNGTVSDFDAGVLLGGGQSNQVRNMTVRDNVGPDDAFTAELGDGIILFDSARNLIANNLIAGNGIFDGIGVLGGDADGNVIHNNFVKDTIGPSDRGSAGQGIIVNAAGLGQNTGVAIIGTAIIDNLVRRNASAGISNINSVDSRIVNNVVRGNGLTNFPGHGIGLQLGPASEASASRALVKGNQVHGNGLDGIHVQLGATENHISHNEATGNNVLAYGYFPAFDLHDLNPGCDANAWRGNRWGSGLYSPACVTAGGSGPPAPSGPETFGKHSCEDGFDNDADGLSDSDDSGCQPPGVEPEGPEDARRCSDGLDNDLDDFVDRNDADCRVQARRTAHRVPRP